MKNLNDILQINEAQSNTLPKWAKAKWSVSVVNLKSNKVETYLFTNRYEVESFFEKECPKYFEYCEGGPSILDQIDDIEGETNGGCYQMCYDEKFNKYYVISYIGLW